MSKEEKKEYFSAPEAAKYLRISRIAVFKKIKNGQLVAKKIGRNYAITRHDLQAIMGAALTQTQKEDIKKVVKRAAKDYRATFEKLAKE